MVETVSFGLLYPALLAVAPNLSSQWLDFYLANAASDLALRTRAVRHTFEQDAQAGCSTYFIDIPEDYTLGFVEAVCVNGIEYHAERGAACAAASTSCEPCSEPSLLSTNQSPTRFTFNVATDRKTFVVFPAPTVDARDGVVTEVSIVPSRVACALPRVIYERHGRAVVDLAVSYLAMNKAANVSPTAQRIAVARAERAERRAKLDADSDAASGPTIIRPPIEKFLI
jgi:hypothetical protein